MDAMPAAALGCRYLQWIGWRERHDDRDEQRGFANEKMLKLQDSRRRLAQVLVFGEIDCTLKMIGASVMDAHDCRLPYWGDVWETQCLERIVSEHRKLFMQLERVDIDMCSCGLSKLASSTHELNWEPPAFVPCTNSRFR